MLFFSLETLLSLVSNVNITDRAGRSSLHHAAYNGHAEVYDPTLFVICC